MKQYTFNGSNVLVTISDVDGAVSFQDMPCNGTSAGTSAKVIGSSPLTQNTTVRATWVDASNFAVGLPFVPDMAEVEIFALGTVPNSISVFPNDGSSANTFYDSSTSVSIPVGTGKLFRYNAATNSWLYR